jgi:hypothetical protein
MIPPIRAMQIAVTYQTRRSLPRTTVRPCSEKVSGSLLDAITGMFSGWRKQALLEEIKKEGQLPTTLERPQHGRSPERHQ